MYPVPEGAKFPSCCTITPMVMAHQTLGQSSPRLCWPVSGTYVPCSCRRPLQVAREMSTTTATQTVAVLRKMFAANGLPEQLVSDNRPQIVSGEFASFCQFNGIKHIRVSLYHPSTNGLAERFIQTFKVAMCKSEKDGLLFSHRLASFLLLYRATPQGELLPFHHLSCSWDVLSVPDWTCCAPIRSHDGLKPGISETAT